MQAISRFLTVYMPNGNSIYFTTEQVQDFDECQHVIDIQPHAQTNQVKVTFNQGDNIVTRTFANMPYTLNTVYARQGSKPKRFVG